jgi:hypothetical protein
MYARVALQRHTVSAVLAGMFVGLLMAALFTGKRQMAAASIPHVSNAPSLPNTQAPKAPASL